MNHRLCIAMRAARLSRRTEKPLLSRLSLFIHPRSPVDGTLRHWAFSGRWLSLLPAKGYVRGPPGRHYHLLAFNARSLTNLYRPQIGHL